MTGSRKSLSNAAVALVLAGLAFGPIVQGALAASGERETDFSPILTEMRSAVAHTADLRTLSDKAGDKVKETCVYERLRGMMQAVESTQVAQVAWESASARGDQEAVKVEVQRAQQALELVRRMRNESDNCVGKELERSTPGSSRAIVTVESNVRDDDPNAGPSEWWKIRPPRLELPGQAIPASPF